MDWFQIWYEDMISIIGTMVRNMMADLEAGYNPNGLSILKQKIAINTKQVEFNDQMDKFKSMDEKQVQRWCYYELKKKGAI